MKLTDYIKKLSDYQLQISFITLGVYFNKNMNAELLPENNPFFQLHKDGIEALSAIDVNFTTEFNCSQIQSLIKIEMYKRGIE